MKGEIKLHRILTMIIVAVLTATAFLSLPIDDEKQPECFQKRYLVRDVHLGYVNGASIICIEYFDNNSIKLIDNMMLNFCEPRRINKIRVERYKGNESWLLRYPCQSIYRGHPEGCYVLYLCDEDKFEGVASNHQYSRRPDEETFLD